MSAISVSIGCAVVTAPWMKEQGCMQNFTPTKPYFLRAVYDWCVDNSLTPYVAVAVDDRTRVPKQYVREGQIVLNIAPYATNQLEIGNEALSCQARFGGVAQLLYVPVKNILAIYARENGRGLAFEPGMGAGTAMELGGALNAAELAETETAEPAATENAPNDDPTPESTPPSGGARLRVVK